VEGSGRGLIQCSIPAFAYKNWGILRRNSGQRVSKPNLSPEPPQYETGASITLPQCSVMPRVKQQSLGKLCESSKRYAIRPPAISNGRYIDTGNAHNLSLRPSLSRMSGNVYSNCLCRCSVCQLPVSNCTPQTAAWDYVNIHLLHVESQTACNGSKCSFVGLGGLVVIVLATRPKVRGFKPGPWTMDF
jgi:hypothetical protein